MALTFEVPDKRTPPSAAALAPAEKWSGTLPDKYVATLVELVSTDRLRADVTSLAAYHTRHTFSASIGLVADDLVGRFVSAGYGGASKVAWSHLGKAGHNVVAIHPGTSGAARVVVICAHYDSRMQVLSDSTSRAPGADDNGSGVAALLELARLLARVELTETVHFVAFSGEEQGLWGSTEYANQLAAAGTPVYRLINLDMVGFPPTDGSITVERDVGNAVATNDAASIAFGSVMAQAAADYTALPVKLGPIYASDYMPFEAKAWITIGAFEGDGNPNYHNTSDDVGTVDFDYLTAVTRLTLATILQIAFAAISEAASGIDLFIRDSLADTGAQPSAVPHWTSPDIWVRNDGSAADDPELGHQPPINGQPNYIWVRVRNRGTLGVAAGAARLKVYRCDPGTGMIWPTDFVSVGELVITDPVPSGGAVRVGPFTWTPAIVDHECLIAIASTSGDQSVASLVAGALNHGLLVRYDNNVGQRNVAPIMTVPGGTPKVSLWLRGGVTPAMNVFELDASALPGDAKLELKLPNRLLAGAAVDRFVVTAQTARLVRLDLSGGAVGRLSNVYLLAGERVSVELQVTFSLLAQHLRRYPIVFRHLQNGVAAGTETIEITTVVDGEGVYFGNRRSLEVHVASCPWRAQMSPRRTVPFLALADALARGYDGCAYCLAGVNRR